MFSVWSLEGALVQLVLDWLTEITKQVERQMNISMWVELRVSEVFSNWPAR